VTSEQTARHIALKMISLAMRDAKPHLRNDEDSMAAMNLCGDEYELGAQAILGEAFAMMTARAMAKIGNSELALKRALASVMLFACDSYCTRQIAYGKDIDPEQLSLGMYVTAEAVKEHWSEPDTQKLVAEFMDAVRAKYAAADEFWKTEQAAGAA
jgi:hypothetical protein